MIVAALGAFNDVPQIGITMAKPAWEAVTVNLPPPEVMLTVGAELPFLYRKGAAACFCVADR
jgi:hypothetical protein